MTIWKVIGRIRQRSVRDGVVVVNLFASTAECHASAIGKTRDGAGSEFWYGLPGPVKSAMLIRRSTTAAGLDAELDIEGFCLLTSP